MSTLYLLPPCPLHLLDITLPLIQEGLARDWTAVWLEC